MAGAAVSNMSEAEDKTAALLAALWLRNRPVVEERMARLDQAIAAAAAGTLTVELREGAADVAHKLAGSLGMYGYEEGTRIAREIEILLDYRTPDEARLRVLAAELRRAILPEG
jgi:HPt (histidine-containing phosphotransfer) domain-containing protein